MRPRCPAAAWGTWTSDARRRVLDARGPPGAVGVQNSSYAGCVHELRPAEGLGVLHLFCQVGVGVDGEAVRGAVKGAVTDGCQVVPVAMLGHKADVGFLAVGPD